MTPLVPLRRAVRVGFLTAMGSRSVLAASLTWFAVLFSSYASDAGPQLAAMCFTAAIMFPIAAAATTAQLTAMSPDVRMLLTAASGRRQAFLADLIPPMVWVTVASLIGFVANQVLGAHPSGVQHPLVWQRRLLGLVLHVVAGGSGVGLALAAHARGLTRGTTALLVLSVAILSLLVPLVPPEGPILKAWGDAQRQPTTVQQVWALTGPLLAAAMLLTRAWMWRRRRL